MNIMGFIEMAKKPSCYSKKQLMANSDAAQAAYVKSGEVVLSAHYYAAQIAFNASMIRFGDGNGFWKKQLDESIEIFNIKFKFK